MLHFCAGLQNCIDSEEAAAEAAAAESGNGTLASEIPSQQAEDTTSTGSGSTGVADEVPPTPDEPCNE